MLLFLAVTAVFFSAAVSHAETSALSPYEIALLDRINQARENPLEAARNLGLDSDQVWADLPDLRPVLENGLPPLAFNENLFRAAKAHMTDMIDRQYYASVTPEGKTPEQRILESGYLPVATGETIGFVGFNNFMDPQDAADILFRNMFLDELNPERSAQKNILNSELKEIGPTIGAGAFQVQGVSTNIYIVNCDFGGSADELVETAILRLINEARRDPLQTIENFSIDETAARSALGEFEWVMDQWLPPLAWHPTLRETARNHNRDMMQRVYYDTINPEGMSAFDRVANVGYSAKIVTEALSIVLSEASIRDPFQIARMLYQNMIMDELNPDADIPANLFNPSMTEIGVGFATTVFELEGNPVHVYLAVADMAQPEEPIVYLIGNVYENIDTDADAKVGVKAVESESVLLPIFGGGVIAQDTDRRFDLMEGIPGVSVILQPFGSDDGMERLTVTSGLAGGYQVPISSGFYEVFVQRDGELFGKGYVSGSEGENYLKDLAIH